MPHGSLKSVTKAALCERVLCALRSSLHKSPTLRLVLSDSESRNVFDNDLEREARPHLAWCDRASRSAIIGFGKSEPAPKTQEAGSWLTVRLDEGPLPTPSALPRNWYVEPFLATGISQAAPGDGEWGSLAKSLAWVPRCLLWQNGERLWFVLSSALAPTRAQVDQIETLVEEAFSTFSRWLSSGRPRTNSLTSLSMPPVASGARLQSPSDFAERVRAVQRQLAPGQFDKVVLAQTFKVDAPINMRWDAWLSFRHLAQNAERLIVFFLSLEPDRAFVGATPEVLCRVVDGQLQTHAVAGTAPRGGTEEQDREFGKGLRASAKDQREHALVVDYLMSRLAPLTLAPWHNDPAPQLLRLPNVQHLATAFKASLAPGVTAHTVATALHPTPAVCGTPSLRARAYIVETERIARGPYAGFLGWQSDLGDGVFAVTIRSMLICPRVATLYAGAGIVSASDPEVEEQETRWKARGAAQSLVARPQ